jgi:cell wall-associated NlpC family hydrolase
MNRVLIPCAVFLFVAPIARGSGASGNVHHGFEGSLTRGASLELSSRASQHSGPKRLPSHSATKQENRSQVPAQTELPKSPLAERENVHSVPTSLADLKWWPLSSNVATIKPEALREFAAQPPKIQQLIRDALSLTEQNLTYKYGSSDPSLGGMDCSGFIYHVLKKAGYNDVPRQSSDQYGWLRRKNEFYAVLSRSTGSFEFRDLMPGDLLFWSGTYQVNREIPITHVMIYLGTEKLTDKPMMVGASDGRSYAGVRRSGVSVFDFKMPVGEPNKSDPNLVAKFVGYGKIPGLRDPHLEAQTNLREPATKNTGKLGPN